jgi:DNA helicase II / ATP-dependent DNA helicase PcrA
VPAACRAPVRFMLQVEISNIYKQGDKVRKVHNLVFAPDLESAGRIVARLAAIGNVQSDGRPILGIDSRDLLEIVLEASPDAFLIPAHVWTPWFSALGAQSGFDAITECYRDLAGHIFAVETGLSSDPAMNWRLSQLDRYALISSSDAHSPEKLGREATLFDCELSYFALRDALRGPRTGLAGTIEFFPEEGKYHLDGHRGCKVVLSPREAQALGGLCPVCGKRLTQGVLARIEALADRPEGHRPAGAKPFHNLIPGCEVLAEAVGVGAASERVRAAWDRLLRRIGPELTVLMDAPLEDVTREGPPLFAEALRRMRAGEVDSQPGYDGEYGRIRVFDEAERRALLDQRSFGFALGPVEAPAAGPAAAPARAPQAPAPGSVAPLASGLNPEQQAVVDHRGGPLLVVAGPGTGKTRALVERIAGLVAGGVSARAITAVSFTRKAAAELGERLVARAGRPARNVASVTFHALSLSLLRAFPAEAGLQPGFEVIEEREDDDPDAAGAATAGAPGPLATVALDELVPRAVALLDVCPPALAHAQQRCQHLLVDEYQDVSPDQDALVRRLAPPAPSAAIVVVGDPDQAIYGFRGADPGCFTRLAADYAPTTVTLTRSYRSPATVLAAASAVIQQAPGRAPRALEPVTAGGPAVERHLLADAAEEAALIAAEIERAVGGTSLSSFDSGRADTSAAGDALAFHDIAVLTRTAAQADALAEALDRATIPHRRVGIDPVLSRPGVTRLVAALHSGLARDPAPVPIGERLTAALAREIVDADLARAAELLAALATPHGDDAAGFLAALPLLAEVDAALAPQKVHLYTLHAAKGLEFPLVFIAGCEDGLLPLRLPGREPMSVAERDEERRLLYVGMTRARQRLVLTAARRRVLFGVTREPSPCPFLAAVPPELLREARTGPRRPRPRQMSLL